MTYPSFLKDRLEDWGADEFLRPFAGSKVVILSEQEELIKFDIKPSNNPTTEAVVQWSGQQAINGADESPTVFSVEVDGTLNVTVRDNDGQPLAAKAILTLSDITTRDISDMNGWILPCSFTLMGPPGPSGADSTTTRIDGHIRFVHVCSPIRRLHMAMHSPLYVDINARGVLRVTSRHLDARYWMLMNDQNVEVDRWYVHRVNGDPHVEASGGRLLVREDVFDLKLIRPVICRIELVGNDGQILAEQSFHNRRHNDIANVYDASRSLFKTEKTSMDGFVELVDSTNYRIVVNNLPSVNGNLIISRQDDDTVLYEKPVDQETTDVVIDLDYIVPTYATVIFQPDEEEDGEERVEFFIG